MVLQPQFLNKIGARTLVLVVVFLFNKAQILLCALLFLFFFPFFLLASDAVFQETIYYSKKEAIDALFPSASTIDTQLIRLSTANHQLAERKLGIRFQQDMVDISFAYHEQELLGYALVLDELGKHYPITFMVGLTPELTVHEIVVMIYREPWGDKVRKKRFLRQFKDKTIAEPFIVDQDVDGLTGATLSSWAISLGVKKALILATLITDESREEKN